MKVLLIQPPVQDFYDTEIRLQPIGLAYLKAAIKKYLSGTDVIIKDFHSGWGRRTVSVPGELLFLKEYYCSPDKSPFSSFYNFYHYGADFDTIAREVSNEKPDFVGISSLFTAYYKEVLETARAIKRIIDVPVVVGGSHVSVAPLSVLKDPCVDFIIHGEGERPLVELIRAWRTSKDFSKVPNLGYKINGRPVFNNIEENYTVEEIPFPDFSDFQYQAYRFKKKPICFVMTSRGCPYKCGFCSVHVTFGREYRRRSIDSVINEIKLRYEQGYRVIDFEDDNLSYDSEEMKLLCKELIGIFPKSDVMFLAMNGICYQNLETEILHLMKEAGFRDLNISLVSTDSNVVKSYNRPHSINKYNAVVEEAFRFGFRIVSYQIIGLPNESVDSMIQTLIFNSRLPVLLGASPFYMTPKIPISSRFPELKENDFVRARLTALGFYTGKIRRADIYTLFITIRIINFIKGLKFPSDIVSVVDLLNNCKKFHSRIFLGLDILDRLLRSKVLNASTSDGYKPLLKFNFELFYRIWNRLCFIMTQDGKKISV